MSVPKLDLKKNCSEGAWHCLESMLVELRVLRLDVKTCDNMIYCLAYSQRVHGSRCLPELHEFIYGQLFVGLFSCVTPR